MNAAALDRVMTPAIVLDALHDRPGAANGISARDFVHLLYGTYDAALERHLRSIIEALRNEGHPIAAHPSEGYYLAANEREINRTCEFLYSRAMTSLKQVAAMKRVALPDLRGQLRLPTEEKEAP